MHFVRKTAVWAVIGVLPLLLLSLAATFALSRTAGSPDSLKSILRDSGIYGSAVDTVLAATDNPNEEGGAGITTDNPAVKEAAKKAFSPQLIQSSAENFIDGLYAWLDGKTPVPNFSIDLTQAKATFINEVAAAAQSRTAGLPLCRSSQTDFDPFAATCRPRGVTPAAAAAKIRQELAGEENFLKDPVITADTIKSDGKPVFSQSSPLPENYQRAKKMPLILALLAFVAVAAIVLLSESRARGLKRAGLTLLITGLFIVTLTWLAARVVDKQLVATVKVENTVLQEQLRELGKDLFRTGSKNYMLAGGIYTGLGALAIAGSMHLARRGGDGSADHHASDSASTQDKKTPAGPARPKPAKIQ